MSPPDRAPVQTEFTSRPMVLLALLAVLITFGGVMVQEIHGTAVFYAAMAREMVETGDLLAPFMGETGYLLKPPLAFWWGAANSLLFGYSNLAMTLPSRLAGLGCIWMTALLARHFHRAPTAVWFAALLFLVNGIYIQFTTQFRLDSLMTFGALLVLWGYLKLPRALGAAALWGGVSLSLMTKGPMILLMLAFLVPHAVFSRHWQGAGKVLLRYAPLLLFPIAWYGFIWGFHGEELSHQLSQDFWRGDTSNLSRFNSVWLEYVTKPMWRLGPWLILIFIAIASECRTMLSAAASPQRRADSALLLSLTVMNVIVAVLKPDPDVRYLYTVLPLVGVMTGGLMLRWLGESVPRWAVNALAAAVCAALLAAAWYNYEWLDELQGLQEMEALATRGELHPGNTVLLVETIPDPKSPRRNDPVPDAVYFYLGLKLPRTLDVVTVPGVPATTRFLLVPVTRKLTDQAATLHWRVRARSEKFLLLERP